MTLTVIGVGYPRTATLSLKLALERIGYAPCHHMTEVFRLSERWPGWIAAASGEPTDWDQLFCGYAATTDAPGCYFFEALAEAYPQAKFVLSVRPAEQWWESASATVLNDDNMVPLAGTPIEQMLRRVVLERYEGRHTDRAYMIDTYERHNARVQQAIPPERLLVYRPGDGWEPLCAFLSIAVPEEPFPRVNDRAEFGKLPLMAGELARKGTDGRAR